MPMTRNSDHISTGAARAAQPAARRQSRGSTAQFYARGETGPNSEPRGGARPTIRGPGGPHRPAAGDADCIRVHEEVTTMKVSTLCSTDVITAEITDTLLEAAQKMAHNHVGALAVLDEGVLVGVISEADLVTAMAEEASFELESVDEFMTEG